jgi:hypothetical protein
MKHLWYSLVKHEPGEYPYCVIYLFMYRLRTLKRLQITKELLWEKRRLDTTGKYLCRLRKIVLPKITLFLTTLVLELRTTLRCKPLYFSLR